MHLIIIVDNKENINCNLLGGGGRVQLINNDLSCLNMTAIQWLVVNARADSLGQASALPVCQQSQPRAQ